MSQAGRGHPWCAVGWRLGSVTVRSGLAGRSSSGAARRTTARPIRVSTGPMAPPMTPDGTAGPCCPTRRSPDASGMPRSGRAPRWSSGVGSAGAERRSMTVPPTTRRPEHGDPFRTPAGRGPAVLCHGVDRHRDDHLGRRQRRRRWSRGAGNHRARIRPRDRYLAHASAAPLPPAFDQTIAWTGTELVVVAWPDAGPIEAAAYDPILDTWRVLAQPPLSPVSRAPAMWTGEEVLLITAATGPDRDGRPMSAIYEPTADCWRVPTLSGRIGRSRDGQRLGRRPAPVPGRQRPRLRSRGRCVVGAPAGTIGAGPRVRDRHVGRRPSRRLGRQPTDRRDPPAAWHRIRLRPLIARQCHVVLRLLILGWAAWPLPLAGLAAYTCRIGGCPVMGAPRACRGRATTTQSGGLSHALTRGLIAAPRGPVAGYRRRPGGSAPGGGTRDSLDAYLWRQGGDHRRNGWSGRHPRHVGPQMSSSGWAGSTPVYAAHWRVTDIICGNGPTTPYGDYGGPHGDVIFGGPGDDVLIGGPGQDELHGGPGS